MPKKVLYKPWRFNLTELTLQKKSTCITYSIGAFLFLFPLALHASFIESTIGTAVVNDATATYHNPAALTLLKNPQIVALGTVSYLHNSFTGQALQQGTGFTLTGTANSNTHYYLPSIYLGIPTCNKVSVGLAVIANAFNRDIDDSAILRYADTSNSIQNIDVVPAIGIKVNEYFSFGAGVTFSHANFDQQPISGFPSLTVPDAQSRNNTSANSWGGDFGVLIRPTQRTLIGFNYRSAVSYQFKGTSTFQGTPSISSSQYQFPFWTPARSILSVSHFVSPSLGFISTLQYIQWSIVKNINISNIATQIGRTSLIIPNATAMYHFHNTWLFTLGGIYRITPKWIIRAAGSYVQTPGNPSYQITNGDSFVLGASMGYIINKNINIDGGYAHAFFKNENIHAVSATSIVNGVNKSSVDSLALKLTFNI